MRGQVVGANPPSIQNTKHYLHMIERSNSDQEDELFGLSNKNKTYGNKCSIQPADNKHIK